jgi:hypothetical protein
MFHKQVIISILVLVTSTSAFAQEQGVTSQTQSQTKSAVDVNALKEADMARKHQLLEQSTKLQALYTQNQEMIQKTQISLGQAKRKCLEVCTKAEIYELVSNVKNLAAITSGTLAGLNSIRMIFSVLTAEQEDFNKSTKFFSKPLSSWGTRLMYGSGIIFAGSKIYENFLAAKDSYTVGEINELQNQLNQYSQNLANIQANINVTNEALAQSIKVEVKGSVTESTSVGYK